MMKSLIALTLLVISIAVAAELPKSVIEQHNKAATYDLSGHDTEFTFIGGFDSISKDSLFSPNGEVWFISLRIEKVVLGEYKKDSVKIGTHDKHDSTFDLNKKYYITIGWGVHGMLLLGHQKIE